MFIFHFPDLIPDTKNRTFRYAWKNKIESRFSQRTRFSLTGRLRNNLVDNFFRLLDSINYLKSAVLEPENLVFFLRFFSTRSSPDLKVEFLYAK